MSMQNQEKKKKKKENTESLTNFSVKFRETAKRCISKNRPEQPVFSDC